MGWWTDLADPYPGTPNQGPSMVEWRGVVLHIAQGYYSGTISWQMNPDSQCSSHFIVAKDGRCTQMVDTDITAWTQREGNGHWLSIEFEGWVPDRLTDAQLSAAAALLARAGIVYGVPLQVAYCPDDKGLGHHSMGAECGVDWGHSECPGINIKNQKPEICARAEDELMTAKDVWSYDVDPSSNSYTAAGAVWTVYGRTDYLSNVFAPQVMSTLADLQESIDEQRATRSADARDHRAMALMVVLLAAAISALIAWAVSVWIVTP